MKPIFPISALSLFAIACSSNQAGANDPQTASSDAPFQVEIAGDFDEPWAMTFLPGGDALVTEKTGKLLWRKAGGDIAEVAGVPKVDYGGQGGLGDVIIAPDFATSKTVYLSYVEAGEDDTRGAVADMFTLDTTGATPKLINGKRIWTQYPKVTGKGHYSHRLVFSPDGKYLFIGSGERQKFDPAQDMDSNMGKIVRLFPDGSIPKDNPFYTEGNPVRSQIWSLGHRNILGIAFDSAGQLWNQEMGPAHGDELNLVKPKANYGYPIVSNGDHYDGRDIPDHTEGDGFEAPAVWWNPAISPAGLAYYNADLFPEWKNSMFIGALGGEALVRVQLNGDSAAKADQWQMDARIREVETGPDGALWVLEDGGKRGEGRLLKLTPKR
ncbi:PQQ-dependent sugar dehydrogenase [Sphingorhabdus arenilitoris]|uniref:PQQ-dependent sugar dehydrogenase n=1 Tax=Sphingorhabdus arenilitoris TaxID=1490041 RepID=A0ABV8RFV5_9SPHN